MGWLSRSSIPLTVLTYHHVGSRAAGVPHPSLTVTTEQFERQMAWLHARGYSTINCQEWLAWGTRAEPPPAKPILITFDDAYADLETTALPVMAKYGFRGVIFAITGRLGLPTPWDGMATMSLDQLLRCAERGMEIGCHTRTHPDLRMLDAGELDREIGGSRDDLQKAGLRPISLAYPFGHYNEAARKAAEAEFQLAFTGREGRNTRRSAPLEMRRTMVLPCDTALDFALRVALGWSPIGRVGGWIPARRNLLRDAGTSHPAQG